MRLAGKVAVITGAGAGIAEASAEIFAREGARVVVAETIYDSFSFVCLHCLAHPKIAV